MQANSPMQPLLVALAVALSRLFAMSDGSKYMGMLVLSELECKLQTHTHQT